MATYTLQVRRYDPEAAEGPYWDTFDVELDPTQSVLDGLLQARADQDGSLAVRCSCTAAICGSCSVKINGESQLACLRRLGEAHAYANRRPTEARAGHHVLADRSPDEPDRADAAVGGPAGGDAPVNQLPADAGEPIVIEPMGNMPVVKDLVTDMESTHWDKFRRVTPWLLPDADPPPGQEHLVAAEAMIDVTQAMACIQCGACVSACLSMEADPEFIGPAALAKAYRFVGDPRDGQHEERLYDLAQDPHGIYDCTHCFACIDACPKDVAPMDQIMRLRRLASHDHDITDRNNGRRHEQAFVDIIKAKGTLDESMLLQESFAPGVLGKLKPPKGAIKALFQSLPTAARGIRTGKMRSASKLIPGIHAKLPGDAQDHVRRIFERAEASRREINMWAIAGEAEPTPSSGRQQESTETVGGGPKDPDDAKDAT